MRRLGQRFQALFFEHPNKNMGYEYLFSWVCKKILAALDSTLPTQKFAHPDAFPPHLPSSNFTLCCNGLALAMYNPFILLPQTLLFLALIFHLQHALQHDITPSTPSEYFELRTFYALRLWCIPRQRPGHSRYSTGNKLPGDMA